MIVFEKINDSFLAYDKDPTVHVRDYYEYCVSLLKKKIYSINKPINIVFGNFNINFNNNNKTIKIDIQVEHTLVKENGRGVKNKIFGNIKDENNNFYLVRVDNFEYFNSLDYVFEYSIPNFYNIKSCQHLQEYFQKTVNISPLFFEINFDKSEKSETITLFSNNPCERRQNFIANLQNQNVSCKHINNCFSKEEILNQYRKSKLLINVHQTDEHHTLEEIRILPALRNGIIILSEDVPLKEKIPYSEFIIWSKYEDLVENVKKIQNNYLYYYNKIFNKNLYNTLKQMEENNFNNLSFLEK